MSALSKKNLSAGAIARLLNVEASTVWRAIGRANIEADEISSRNYKYYGPDKVALIKAAIPSVAAR